MKFALLLISAVAFAAPSVVVTGTTSQQITVDIRGLTGTPAQCSVTAYLDAALTVKANDTNVAIFVGSEACPRAYNVVVGNQIAAVIGRRTSDPADCVSSCAETAGTLVSRSLELARAYWIKVTDTANSTSTVVTATTKNMAWGKTDPEVPPYNASGFNRSAYPTLDYSSDAALSKRYIDPMTGVELIPIVRQMYGCSSGTHSCHDESNELHFPTAFDIAGTWTNPLNAINTSVSGPFASTSGTGAIFLPFKDSTGISDQFFSSDVLHDLRVNLYGSGASATADDRTMFACIALEFAPSTNQCTSAEIPVVLQQTTASRVTGPASYPSYRFTGWSFPAQPDQEHLTVIGDGGYKVTVTSSVAAISIGYLPTFAATGMKIQIGTSSSGTWYTIATITDALHFTLVESGVNVTDYWFTMGNAGIRLRKKTASGAVNVAATYSYAYANIPKMPANGQRDFCSPLTFSVNYQADGTTALSPPQTARLCISGTDNRYEFMLLDNGESRYVSNLDHPDLTLGLGIPPSIAMGMWSLADPYTFIAIHGDDSGSAGVLPDRAARVFFKVTYDPSTCHFKNWTGNVYATVTAPPDCVNWVNQNTYAAGRSINQQADAILASNPVWPTGSSSNWDLSWMSGNFVAAYQRGSAQDNVCWTAIFDTRTWDLVRLFDSFTGNLSGMRWGGCHSYGIDLSDRADHASFAFSLLTARTQAGYLSGPYLEHGPTRISLDGGTNWRTNTSLTSGTIVAYPNANCGSPPTLIQPGTYFETTISVLSCVDVSNAAGLCSATAVANGARPGMNCFKADLPDDRPCSSVSNDGGDPREYTRWPCPWHTATGWSSPMAYQVGDFFTRFSGSVDTHFAGGIGGKNEAMAIRDKVSNGSGGYILEVERWTSCDNPSSDPALGAVLFYDHLFSGTGGATHENGWNIYMKASHGCSGSNGWLDLSSPTAIFHADDSAITSSHNTIGASPDGLHRTQVGPGGARTGDMPAMSGNAPDHTFNTDNVPFAGISKQGGGELEQYPSLTNWIAPTVERRSSYWDWRHVNPDAGTDAEDQLRIWTHTYTPVSGQVNLYKVDVHGTYDHKIRRAVAFSPRGAFYDVSGPSSTIDGTMLGAYCSAYKANECRSGSSVGDFFVALKNANLSKGGCTVDTYRMDSICVTAPHSNMAWMIEQATNVDDPTGDRFRRITMGLTGPGAQYQYTSPHMTADGKFAIIRPGMAGGVQGLWAVRMPPASQPDSVTRSRYIKVPVQLPAGSGYARVRWGFAENAPDGSHLFYATSRQEETVTDSSANPFAFTSAFPSTSGSSDTLTPTNCTSGCTINIPLIPGRVAYWRLERSPNGTSGWVAGPTQVTAVY